MTASRSGATLRNIRHQCRFFLMSNVVRRAIAHPLLALGCTVLLGMVELGALWRSRFARRLARDSGVSDGH